MHLIRLAVISFLVLAVLITGISLFIPSNVRISRSVVINGSKDSVLAQIRDAERWKAWYPGIENAKPMLADGKTKGVIFDDSDPKHPVYVGLTGEKENEVNAEFVTKKMNPVTYSWVTGDGPIPGTTTLQWNMNFKLRWYPWEKFASLTLEKTQGPPMEEGLANIKKITEN